LPVGRRGPSLDHAQQRACRVLVKSGCDSETLHRIVSYVKGAPLSPEARSEKLAELASFTRQVGTRAAQDYFRAIRVTGAVAELTDSRVLAFGRSVSPHTAEWYFWALWGTRAVRELTDPRVLDSIDFFRSIEGSATVEYFLAIRETGAAGRLTQPNVMAFAQAIGADAAVEYFGSFWETNAVDLLTSEKVLEGARSLKGDSAKEYFQAIRETKAVAELTDPRVLGFADLLGNHAAEEFFRAVRATRAAQQLTSDRVTVFAEVIGKSCAEEYFRVITSTKKVAELTSERLLRASSVIRAIGSDAALDYFLAVAATGVVPTPGEATNAREAGSADTSVPVLTLLDVPKYRRYRPIAWVGASAAFWWGVWQWGVASLASSQGQVNLVAAVGAWATLLCAVHLLAGVIADRSSEEFVRRRRRLLNEHGIHWHDCLAGNRQCPRCWDPAHTHRDDHFDYGRFCRCTAC